MNGAVVQVGDVKVDWGSSITKCIDGNPLG